MDVQRLVTHANSVTIMEREMGHPPRMIRGPGLVDRWASYGIAAQVVQIVPDEEPSSCPEPAGRDTNTRVIGPIRYTGSRIAPPTAGETR